jgi:uncharacterized RDD family membrane protein YckC
MNMSFRKGVVLLVVAGLGVLTGIVQAQNEPQARPPPVNIEAPEQPEQPANPAEPPAPPATNVEAPDQNAADANPPATDQTVDDRFGRSRRHRHGSERVQVGGNSTLNAGERADSVVSVFGTSTSAGDAGDVVSVMGETRVIGGTAKDVVAVLGNVYLNGKASGDVVASFGNVELGPQAEVSGDVVVVGGELKRDPTAVVHGDVQHVLSFASGSFEWLHPWVRHCLILGRPLALAPGLGWAWGLALGFLALYVLIGLLFSAPVERTVRMFEAQPGRCIIAALLATVLTPVLFALLLITVIGIPFMPFVALGLFLVGLFGKAVVLAWIGHSCVRLGGEGRVVHTALAVALGGAVITVLYLVPFIGFIVYKVLGILGLGVAVYALIQNTKERRGGGGPELAAAGGSVGGGSATFREPTIGETGPSSTSSTWDFGRGASSGTTSAFNADDARNADAAGAAGSSPQVWDATASSGAGPSAAGGTSSADEASAGAPGAAHVYGTSHSTDAGDASRASDSPHATRATPPPPPPPPREPPVNTAALTYPRAGFGIRMAALFIDVILVAVLLGIVDSTREAELIALATYGAVMWKLKGTTIGGIVFGLQVIRLDGRPIDWATSTVRALSCFLSLVVAGLGFIWIAFDEGNQAWHDKIAGTAVVRVPKGVSLL